MGELVTLAHGQQIKVVGFKHRRAIIVHTLAGDCLDDGLDYVEQLKKDMSLGSVADAYTIQKCACLSKTYNTAVEEAKEVAFNSAVSVYDGQKVLIDGSPFVVVVNGEGFSDPVAFRAWRLFDEVALAYNAKICSESGLRHCIIIVGNKVVCLSGYDGNRVVASFEGKTTILGTFETVKDLLDRYLSNSEEE